jgi:hypothetical protein
MEEVLARRAGSDGPARFYLTKIAEAEKSDPTSQWDGVIEFPEK